LQAFSVSCCIGRQFLTIELPHLHRFVHFQVLVDYYLARFGDLLTTCVPADSAKLYYIEYAIEIDYQADTFTLISHTRVRSCVAARGYGHPFHLLLE